MTAFGPLLRQWRTHRRLSQLALAGDAEVSTRHLSCLETGKARPSREMVLVLGSALDLPLRERNTLLQAAGFATAYSELDLDAPELLHVRRAVNLLLANHDPYPAYLVDTGWNVLQANDGARRFWALLTQGGAPEGTNAMETLFDPNGFRPYVKNFEVVAQAMLQRLHREALLETGATSALLERILAYPGVPALQASLQAPSLFVPLQLSVLGHDIEVFTTVTTLGTPTDVTLSELRIEHVFPANDETAAIVQAMVDL